MAKEAKKKEKKMKDNTNKKDSKKDKRHFFKDVKAELKKVIWPTPKQLLNNTLAVIASVIIVGVIVFLLDLCFEKINTFGIEKLKTVVQSSQNEEADNVIENDSTEDNVVENSDTDNVQENIEDSAEGSSEDNLESTDNAE
ncbi:MAG: preprotein translocase subunit SecE [Clostridia bacterium]